MERQSSSIILFLTPLFLFWLLKFYFPALAQPIIDLNRASKEDLEKLPGIGPVLSQKIIELREKKGGFQRVEDLLEVNGIGPKKLESLRPYLKVETTHSPLVVDKFTNQSIESPKKPIYKFVDERGVIHFTQFPETVPQRYRKSLKEFK